jgi:hypothetical protein
MSNDIPKISSFAELMNEVSWSYEYPNHPIIKYNNGAYGINKLFISPQLVSYKTDSWLLEDGVFEDFELFVKLVEGIKPV